MKSTSRVAHTMVHAQAQAIFALPEPGGADARINAFMAAWAIQVARMQNLVGRMMDVRDADKQHIAGGISITIGNSRIMKVV